MYKLPVAYHARCMDSKWFAAFVRVVTVLFFLAGGATHQMIDLRWGPF